MHQSMRTRRNRLTAPVQFIQDEEVRLTNADGNELLMRIVDVVLRSSLDEYWTWPLKL